MFTFPTHLFNPESIKLKLAGATVTGGEALSGETDVIRTDGGGYWLCEMRGIHLHTDDLLRAWQAWEDHLEDGVTKILLPVPELRTAPRPVAGGILSRPSQLAVTGDDYFPEAVAFAAPWIEAVTVGSAALRATSLVINVTGGARLKGGERFAIAHATEGRRVYRVGRITAQSGQQATVTIRPPLREAVADATAVDFDWPSMVAVKVPDFDISPTIERGRYGRVDITFRESF
jgi:hypothetical protein